MLTKTLGAEALASKAGAKGRSGTELLLETQSQCTAMALQHEAACGFRARLTRKELCGGRKVEETRHRQHAEAEGHGESMAIQITRLCVFLTFYIWFLVVNIIPNRLVFAVGEGLRRRAAAAAAAAAAGGGGAAAGGGAAGGGGGVE